MELHESLDRADMESVPALAVEGNPFSEGISGFADTLAALEQALAAYPSVYTGVFDSSDEWRRLLRYKIVPQLSADGCLVVAVAGGTNTGKSTLFNLLLQEAASAARSTAAATCSPVLVTAAERYRDGLEGRILNGFAPRPLTCPEDSTRYEMPEDTLWVSASSHLPACLALMDTPDVDSIERRNWKVADQIRAAGDVVIAVLTPEKYKDARVVEFFRNAHASGRLVVPIMNKANPRNDYAAARVQLAEFIRDAGLDTPSCFVLPFDYAVETEMDFEIRAIDGDMSLMEYLRNLDVVEVKRRVYRDSLDCFLAESGVFLEHVEGLRNRLREVRASFERRALNLAVAYHAQPGEGMGKLIHEQIRAQRHAIVRGIARFNDAAFKHLEPVGGFVRRHVLRGSGRRVVPEAERLAELRETQRDRVKQIAMDFAAQLTEHARDMEPLAGGLVREGLDGLRVEEIAESISLVMLGDADRFSEEFRDHMGRTVEQWWKSNPDQRRFLLELDAVFVFAPSALLVFVGSFTAGVGAPEMMAIAGPAAGEALARILENKYSEKWVGMLQPWQQEQRERLAVCIIDRLVKPGLGAMHDVLDLLENGYLDQLRKDWRRCQQDSQES